MSPELLIEHSQLPTVSTTGASSDFASQCHALLIQQKLTWEMLRTNYAGLDEVRVRTLDIEGFALKLQFNPRRLTSSAAKVDDKSIRERKCFLCPGNLPAQQRALPFEDKYLILCNPFPIMHEHFTIGQRQHVAQLIDGEFQTLLSLARAMASRYTVFYNGPRCGASAPDHLHFQAGTRNWMPLELEFDSIKSRWGRSLLSRDGLEATGVFTPVQNFIALESADANALEAAFQAVYVGCQRLAQTDDEPMLNILCSFGSDRWQVIIFPRAKHRPQAFFAEGDDCILFSPASVDLGGVCVLPVESDFNTLTADRLRELFQEVCLSRDTFDRLCTDVMGDLRR